MTGRRPVLTIVVRGVPGPQGSKKARPIYKGRGKSRVFTGRVAQQESSKKVQPWRQAVEAAALMAMGGTPYRLDGPLLADMVFTLTPPKSRPTWWPPGMPWSKTTPMRPAGYPDVSKLARSTEDALTTAGAWVDDGRVVEYGRLAKVYPGPDPDALTEPGAVIRVWEVNPVTAVQLDLFASDTDTRRMVDGLTCIRDAIPDAMYVVIHLAYWPPQDQRNIGASGDWAYSIRRTGLRFEHQDDWWRGAFSRSEPYGWDRTPAHRITWPELAEQIGDDPRRPDLTTWAQSLAEPAWRELARPHELWPDPEQWHPNYITGDHQHPGWDQRYTAWRTLHAILTDAMARLDTPFDLETTP